jgi:hypothetical protein
MGSNAGDYFCQNGFPDWRIKSGIRSLALFRSTISTVWDRSDSSNPSTKARSSSRVRGRPASMARSRSEEGFTYTVPREPNTKTVAFSGKILLRMV